jgi:hypothetical protein
MEGMYKFKRNAMHSTATIVTTNASQWAKRDETHV